jgi:MSHA biogenesis protein MshG
MTAAGAGLFRYRGRRLGEPVAGQLEAPSPETVANELLALGITPIEIVALRERDDVFRAFRHRIRSRGVPPDDLIMFTRQMYTMVRAGIPIVSALRGIGQVTHSESLAQAVQEVLLRVEAGQGLTASLQEHPKVFPRLFLSTLRMGEDTGRLEEAFGQLASHLEADRETRRRIRAATRYPTLVVVAIAVALVILNVFALPVFAEVFADFGAELPWATRLLIGTSAFTAAYWPHFLVAVLAVALGARGWLGTPSGRLWWDRFKLRAPVLGSILEKATLSRFARTFSLCLRSGVPLIQAIDIAAGVAENQHVAGRLQGVRAQLERGDSLARTAAASGLFTPLVLQMLAVGEATGALEDLLYEVAEFYERDVDYELKRIAQSIEPILLLGVGLLVLVLALGVYLPMWDLARAAGGG